MLKSIFPLLAIFVTCSCNNAGKETENTGPDSTGAKQYNAEQLVSPADSLSAEPYLFTDDHGMVYLSWIEKRNDSSWLKFSTLNNDQWSAPVTIRSGNNWFVNWADYPQLATDGGNNMVAHFLERSDTGYSICRVETKFRSPGRHYLPYRNLSSLRQYFHLYRRILSRKIKR